MSGCVLGGDGLGAGMSAAGPAFGLATRFGRQPHRYTCLISVEAECGMFRAVAWRLATDGVSAE